MAETHDDYVAKRFLDKIGVKKVEPLPPPAPAAPAKPPEPVKLPVVEKPAETMNAAHRRRYLDELDGLETLRQNTEFFDEDLGTEAADIALENGKLVIQYIMDNFEGYVSHRNVVKALEVLRGKLTPVRKPEPPKPAAPAPPPAPVPVELPPPLPPVPDYMTKSNPLVTYKDVRALPLDLYKRFYYGPDAKLFRARVEEITRRVSKNL